MIYGITLAKFYCEEFKRITEESLENPDIINEEVMIKDNKRKESRIVWENRVEMMVGGYRYCDNSRDLLLD